MRPEQDDNTTTDFRECEGAHSKAHCYGELRSCPVCDARVCWEDGGSDLFDRAVPGICDRCSSTCARAQIEMRLTPKVVRLMAALIRCGGSGEEWRIFKTSEIHKLRARQMLKRLKRAGVVKRIGPQRWALVAPDAAQ